MFIVNVLSKGGCLHYTELARSIRVDPSALQMYSFLVIQRLYQSINHNFAHSSDKCNIVTDVGKKPRRKFYSQSFYEVYCLVDSEFV